MYSYWFTLEGLAQEIVVEMFHSEVSASNDDSVRFPSVSHHKNILGSIFLKVNVPVAPFAEISGALLQELKPH